MPSRFVVLDRQSPMLLPPDIRDWVAPESPARLIVELVESIDLSTASVNHHGTGSEQYPPSMILALLLYAYSHGVFSSRKIEQMTYEHIGVRYICADHHPDHDTICKFRRENPELIKSTFSSSLQLAGELGILNIGSLTVAMDGTKIEADVNAHETPTIAEIDAQIAKLELEKLQWEKTVEHLLKEAEQIDRHENQFPQSVPTELSNPATRAEKLLEAKRLIAKKERRKANLLAAKAAFAQNKTERAEEREKMRQEVNASKVGTIPRKVDATVLDSEKINPSDPDATKMKSRNGYIQGYNAQGAVDIKSGLLVAAYITTEPTDRHQLQGNLTEIERNLGTGAVDAILGDSGYDNTYQIHKIEQKGGPTMLCEQQGRKKKAVAEDAESSNGEESATQPKPSPVTGQKKRTREYRNQLYDRLRDDENRARRRKRKETIEPSFGIIKEQMGFRRFHLRGRQKVDQEWRLAVFALNLRKLNRNPVWVANFNKN